MTEPATSEFIRYAVEDTGIATITIDRPEKRNAMTWPMNNALYAALDQASEDNAVRAVILTGVPGVFCAGTDLADLSNTPKEKRGGSERGSTNNPDGWWPVTACTKPVIAAVDGPAIGMGAEIPSQCDVRIASTRARFGWVFVHRGLVPDTGAGTWLLPRLIGVAEASRLLYSGDIIDAAEAERIGFVQKVVEPDALMDAARAEALRFCQGSPFSVTRIKKLMYEGLVRELPEHMKAHNVAIQECFASKDHQEGIASFLEKRDAKFTGR